MLLRTINPEIFQVRGEVNQRTREFVISNERRDSHGTVIRLDSWRLDDFNRSGAFYYQHLTGGGWGDPNPDNALGPATARVENNELIGTALFEPAEINPLADKILGKVDFGTLRCTSVGFIPNGVTSGHWGVESRSEDPETYYFTDVTLKEFSIVHIPSNPDAVKKSLESFDQFMARVAETHKSEGFKRDYKGRLRMIRQQRDYLISLGEKRNYF